MYERYVKRALDVVISLVSMVVLSPLFALIALFLILGVTHTSFFGLFGG